jgi:hypothetical protein
MRSAIRGDFERLAERRGGQELMSVDDEPPEPDLEKPTPGPEPASEPEPAPEAEPEPDTETEPEPELDDARSSWLDRLLGR